MTAVLWKRAAKAHRRVGIAAETGRLRARELLESCRALSEQRRRRIEELEQKIEDISWDTVDD